MFINVSRSDAIDLACELSMGWRIATYVLAIVVTTFFGLLTMINEGLLVWLLIKAGAVPGVGDVPLSAFLIQFITTWLVVWLVANGPVQIFFTRWRFRGGRFW